MDETNKPVDGAEAKVQENETAPAAETETTENSGESESVKDAE